MRDTDNIKNPWTLTLGEHPLTARGVEKVNKMIDYIMKVMEPESTTTFTERVQQPKTNHVPKRGA